MASFTGWHRLDILKSSYDTSTSCISQYVFHHLLLHPPIFSVPLAFTLYFCLQSLSILSSVGGVGVIHPSTPCFSIFTSANEMWDKYASFSSRCIRRRDSSSSAEQNDSTLLSLRQKGLLPPALLLEMRCFYICWAGRENWQWADRYNALVWHFFLITWSCSGAKRIEGKQPRSCIYLVLQDIAIFLMCCI